MKNLWLTLAAVFFMASFIPPSVAQKPKAPQNPAASSTVAEKDRPKGEVDLAVEELKKRGEGVVTMVGSESTNSKDKIKDGVINGRAIELVQPPYPRSPGQYMPRARLLS
jgi:hypothetical protein